MSIVRFSLFFLVLNSFQAFAEPGEPGKSGLDVVQADVAHVQAACPKKVGWVRRLVDEKLLNPSMAAFFQGLLRTRYKVTTEGLDKIAPGGGILFLPNHPGWTDPAIQYTNLFWRFKAQPVGYENEVNRTGIFGFLIKRTNPLVVPDASRANAEQEVDALAHSIADALRAGKNILMYPEGMLSRTLPDLEGKSLVERILKIYPEARIVLSQMNGHLGSSFGAVTTGDFPNLAEVVPRRLLDLAAGGIFFMPKRPIHVKYEEVTDVFPRNGTRHEIATYLTNYYRTGLLPPRYVPYRRSEPTTVVDQPYPSMPVVTVTGVVDEVPVEIRKKVLAKLSELTGVPNVTEGMDLARDLGMDSLTTQELNLWIEMEFKVRNNAPIKTVAEALLIAGGKQATTGAAVRPPSGPWIRDQGLGRALALAPEATDLLAAFRHQCAKNPDRVAITDQTSGPKTYRDIAMAIDLMAPWIKRMKGQYIGIMLPTSVGGVIAYYATLFAGKTPVQLNFTAGETKVKFAVDSLGSENIVTSQRFLDILASPGKDISFPSLEPRFRTLEDFGASLSSTEKLAALLRSERRGFWHNLPTPNITPDTQSVILFTSGSESNPKAVPYTHGMDVANMGDVASRMGVTDSDRVMTITPFFHSLGFRLMTTSMSMGVPQVFHGDPTDGATIAVISKKYRPTIIVGTPTFMKGIAHAAEYGDLDSYRLGVMGAEKLTDEVVWALAGKPATDTEPAIPGKAPKMVQVEGYGSTELGPVVALNPADAPRRGSIGLPVDSVYIRIVDPADYSVERPLNVAGMMLVAAKDPRRSPIMTGYLNYKGEQPFVTLDGRRWFISGDLVMRQEGGYLKFISRLKRSGKIGGEMVSYDGLEETLAVHPTFASPDGKPTVAVEPTPVEVNPELVLFTAIDGITVDIANQILRKDWSKTFKISRVVKVAAIPLLGTGKIDRQSLKVELEKK